MNNSTKKCKLCGTEFIGYRSAKYCSLDCAFFDRVYWRSRNDCWEFKSATIGLGYKVFRYNKTAYRAHRIAYEILVGPIPEGLHVCHSCDNRWCVNPDHLFLGTHQENIKDMVNKDRQAKGAANGAAVLNEELVKEIRESHTAGAKLTALARMFGTTVQNIHRVVKRRTWKHV